ncbi:aromatic ring-hydroxylating dioxygenase subunit alpha [Sphingomonas sp. So64.6b]|uniref:aromatic ring-hydroxylating oxygenase subunit alpha n=1 Tax=Sphingomonas sp. So64.6b TaxID=2997354 RepID=UPI0016027DD8|nr:aromatic ring-hydroxylating dioxygenase subunit alpha [Sphingomonas sp. So64.6b]QNA83827.1 aromatic ring-hydroxylating dioxygenase subunit alpha [Sphingomonas sp. So64.6b]
MSKDWPSEIAKGWHPLAEVKALRDKPLARRLMGKPIVLFLSHGKPVALLDRCPHRGLPLSGGCVKDGAIACPYHGWRFGVDGACVEVPGSDIVPNAPAQALPIVIRAGLVWTSLAETPAPFPRLPDLLEDPALDHFCWAVEPTRMRLLDGIENMLDASHPHYVHPWFLRGIGKRRAMQVDVTLGPDGAEAIYHENARADGFMPRLLEGKRTVSIGRYFPPTIGQLVFETERGLTVSLTAIFVPEDVNLTRPYALFTTRKAITPAWLKRWVLKAFNLPLLRQDQRVLEDQVDALADWDEIDFAVGPADLIGPTVWRLANGRPQPHEKRTTTLYL